MTAYGSLEVKSAPSKGSKLFKIAGATVAAMMVLAYASVTHTRSVMVSRVVDANRSRGSASPVCCTEDTAQYLDGAEAVGDGWRTTPRSVQRKTAEVVNMTEYGLRWAIFGFDAEDTRQPGAPPMIVPIMEGRATDDWRGDWDRFVGALPKDSCAAAIYNFQYWVQPEAYEDEEGNEVQEPEYYDLDPLLITWAPAHIEKRDVARYGYYLGALIVATDHPDPEQDLEIIGMDGLTNAEFGDFNDPDGDGYKNFCRYREAQKGRDGSACDMIDDFHNCPFPEQGALQINAEERLFSPCVVEEVPQCRGAQYVEIDDDEESEAGAMTHECCNYVKNYCAKSDAGNHQADGCGGTAMETIEQLCELKVPKVVECVGDCSDYGCDPVCESPCPLIGAKSTTFEHCSGCPTTGLPDEDGKTYQCFPGAYGFQDYRCCGLHPECADETEELECQGADLSDVMAKRCAWVTHGSCRALKQQQEIEYIFGTVADPENAGASLPNVDQLPPGERIEEATATAGVYGCCIVGDVRTPAWNVNCPTIAEGVGAVGGNQIEGIEEGGLAYTYPEAELCCGGQEGTATFEPDPTGCPPIEVTEGEGEGEGE